MRLARCEKGHYYDKDKFSTCPHCNDMQIAPSETVAFEDPDAKKESEAKKEADVVVPDVPKVEVEERVLFSAATPVDEENKPIEDDFVHQDPSVTEDDLDEMVTIRLSEQEAVVSSALAGVETTSPKENTTEEESSFIKEEPVRESSSSIEEEPVREESSSIEEEPIREDNSFMEEEPAREESSSIEEEPVREESSFMEEEPVRESSSFMEEEPIKESSSFMEEEPIRESSSFTEEGPVREETPSIEEEPIRESSSFIEEVPVREETSSIEEETIGEESSSIEEESVREETSAIENEFESEETSVVEGELTNEEIPAVKEEIAEESVSAIEEADNAEESVSYEEEPVREEAPDVEDDLITGDEDTAMEQGIAATSEMKEEGEIPSQPTLADAVPDRIPDEVILEEMNSNPVIGWLVAIDGTHKGMSYNVKQGRNFVGRSTAMDICLAGNSKISRDRHAIITFDPRTKKCYLQPDESRDLIYINDDLLFGPMTMQHNDVITMGEEQFVFLALQCDKADWI